MQEERRKKRPRDPESDSELQAITRISSFSSGVTLFGVESVKRRKTVTFSETVTVFEIERVGKNPFTIDLKNEFLFLLNFGREIIDSYIKERYGEAEVNYVQSLSEKMVHNYVYNLISEDFNLIDNIITGECSRAELELILNKGNFQLIMSAILEAINDNKHQAIDRNIYFLLVEFAEFNFLDQVLESFFDAETLFNDKKKTQLIEIAQKGNLTCGQ